MRNHGSSKIAAKSSRVSQPRVRWSADEALTQRSREISRSRWERPHVPRLLFGRESKADGAGSRAVRETMRNFVHSYFLRIFLARLHFQWLSRSCLPGRLRTWFGFRGGNRESLSSRDRFPLRRSAVRTLRTRFPVAIHFLFDPASR